MNKNILIISFAFPPNNSIGSRRWAKFAKQLAKKGYKIHVIAEKSMVSTETNWNKDILSNNINIHYLSSNYPKIIMPNKTTFVAKGLKKGASILISTFKKGILQDRAIFWKKSMLKKANKLIEKHNIINVITTGPPHRVNYYATFLKKKNKINLICDIRDTWSDGKVYGINNLSKSKKDAEEKMEEKTVREADYLLFVNNMMKKEFSKKYKNIYNEKFITIPHAFDLSDYKVLETKDITNSDKIRFIYGGTITMSAVNDVIIPFFKALQKIKKENFEVSKKIEFNFYGENIRFKNLIEEFNLSDIIFLKPLVAETEFFKKARNSTFLFAMLGNEWKEYMTTKNILYLPFKRPIVLLSNKGFATDFIEKNKLGYTIYSNNCYSKLNTIISDHQSKNIRFNKKFNINEFSYENQTEKIISLLR